MKINTTRRNQATATGIMPQKLYTQNEVDNLMKATRPLPTESEREIRAVEKQKRINRKSVADLVKKSNRILVSVSSHKLPFDLFPDMINVEEGRITIINRHFLASEVHSVDIKDISNIFINTSIIFSQLVIISKTFEQNEIKIRNLWTKEAVYIRRIIEGLRVFENQKINTSNYSIVELVTKLEELSTTDIVM